MGERNKRVRRRRRGVDRERLVYTAGVVLLAGLVWLGWRGYEEQVVQQANQGFVTRATAMLGVDCGKTTQPEYAEIMHSRTFDPDFLTNITLGEIMNVRGERVPVSFDQTGEPVMSIRPSRVEYPLPDRYLFVDLVDGSYGIRVYGTEKVKEEFEKFFLTGRSGVVRFLRGYFAGVKAGEMHINFLGGNVEAQSINHPELDWNLNLTYQAAGQLYGIPGAQVEGALVQLNAKTMHNVAEAEGVGLYEKVKEAFVNERAIMLARAIEPFSNRQVSEGASTLMGMVAALDESCAELGMNSDPNNPLLRKIAEVMKDQGVGVKP